MILLTKLNNKTFYLNCDLIESIAAKPDTVITLRNGKLVIVQESPQAVVQKTVEFKRQLLTGLITPLDMARLKEQIDGEEEIEQ